MMDRRELILARLFVAVSAVPIYTPPVAPTTYVPATSLSHWRNRDELPEDKRPAIVQLDGVESPATPPRLIRTHRDNRGATVFVPNMMTMTPQLFYLAFNRTPKNEGIGEELNEMRIRILNAVATDAILLGLIGSNGEIEYRGSLTDLVTGGFAEGQLQVNLGITYPFIPSEL